MKIKNLVLLFTSISLAATAAVYNMLPAEIPLGILPSGETYGNANKIFIWIFAALPLFLLAAEPIVRKFKSQKDLLEKNKKVFHIVIACLMLMLISSHWLRVLFILGYVFNITFYIKVLTGFILVIIGNYLPLIRFNSTLGLKTPWTLSSEKIWNRLHRISGKAYTLIGALTLLLAFVEHETAVYFAPIMIAITTAFLVYYSYKLSQDEKHHAHM